MATMKAVIKKSAAPGATIEQIDVPRCGPDEVLLKVRAASICGTDLHIYSWSPWAQTVFKPPLVFGHEVAGEVVETGKLVENFVRGDRVSVESHIPCGSCMSCSRDLRHICDNLKILGVDRAGCFAEYVVVPALCAWKNPPGMAPEIASILEPMGNAVHAAVEAGVSGKAVAIFGCGPTGLFAVGAARALGAARICAVEVNRSRLLLAGTMGADELLDGSDPDLVGRLQKSGGGSGLDVAFDMSGNATAITQALRALRKGGTLVAFGIPSRPIEIDLANEVIMKGRRILGIVGRHMFRTWEVMQRLLDARKLDPAPVITHRYKLAEFEEAFKTLGAPDTACGKVVLFP